MNKLINKAVFIIAIILIFGSLIFKPRETTTDKKLETNHIDISNNRGIWRELEIYSIKLVNQGFQLYSFAGGNGELKRINKGKISVPKYVWKVILIENSRSREVDAISEAGTYVIAVIMPNSEKVRKTDWQDYIVTVNKVESVTGYDFFAYLSDEVEEEIESKVYQ